MSKNTQNCFAYNSATKYCSEAVLYSKQNFAKTPNFGCVVHTHIRVRPFIFCSKKDRLCLIRRHVNFQQPNQFIEFTLSHLKQIIFNHSEGLWEGRNKSVPYTYIKIYRYATGWGGKGMKILPFFRLCLQG